MTASTSQSYAIQENDIYTVDSKQPLPNRDEKILPPPPPPPVPMHVPVETMSEILPSKRSVRRRHCLFGWLCVALIFIVAAVLVFVVYGIPASHCCGCLMAYDKCMGDAAAVEQTCLAKFDSCSAGYTYIFFSCHHRLYDRYTSCWINYFE